MLSILIPVYNYDVHPLVNALSRQIDSLNEAVEIIVMDDASSNQNLLSENRKLNQLAGVKYLESEVNLGRSKVRNALAARATYDYLLFLDADVLPVMDNFLSEYLRLIQTGTQFAFGGWSYECFSNKSNFLRIQYGRRYESPNLRVRQSRKRIDFISSNFLVKRKLFNKVCFKVLSYEYGYEDLLLAYELTKNGTQLTQIDNPVYHLGIDDNKTFLEKQEVAMRNAYQLIVDNSPLVCQIKILTVFKRIQAFKLQAIMTKLYKFSGKWLRNGLIKGELPVILLQIYKLLYLCSLTSSKIPTKTDS